MSVTNRTRLKIWFLLVVVFGLGYVTGVAVIELYNSRASGDRSEARERAMHEGFENMRRELNLSDEQTTSLRAVLDETRNEYRTLRTELRPRFEEPRQKARARIRALLTPAQQQKFDAIVAHQGARHGDDQESPH
jgi:Spy/CpxP family protein refolding chaperone